VKQITIADVARQAGVSTATVSRVLAGLGGARPATRARIEGIARDLGYRPSAVARSLKMRTTRTLGLVVTSIENPYFPQLVRAVEDAAHREGYALLLCNAEDVDRKAFYLDLLVDRRVDGVVIAASGLGEVDRARLRAARLPIVLVNTVARGLHLPSVVSDNRAGGRLAGDHLISLCHRSIGVLTAGPQNADAPLRLAGVRDAARRAGLDPQRLPVTIGEPGVAGGEAAMAEMLERSPGVTAIVAYNDLVAIGAMRALRARGRRVPRDVSIVGFDDVDLATYLDPPLTTIAQSTADLGRIAVGRLVDLLRDGSGAGASSANGGPARSIVVPVTLRIRGSSGPPV
jgi:DNA-binding LacI/PurR family transcriptional regulator